ncbi:hypothetical protein LOK49_LG12G00678 [Camellia lanceoleosa]|uniref:Uncharacterized protein n=1 Tax=Camellia lanceoleosa TaxID=1840588 RepID=A0ACC0FU42_9ERIC|nr:hypothetical protein LOK49_LG12G00678 [Camellia lanceoleosa]
MSSTPELSAFCSVVAGQPNAAASLISGNLSLSVAQIPVGIYKSECFQRIAADPHGASLEYTKRIQCGNSNTTTGRTKDIYMHEQWWMVT